MLERVWLRVFGNKNFSAATDQMLGLSVFIRASPWPICLFPEGARENRGRQGILGK